MIDHAIDRVEAVTGAVAVNVHHGRHRLEDHLGDRVHISVEEQPGLGTSGALVELASWLDDRPVLVTNADTLTDGDISGVIEAWDRERVAVILHEETELGPRSRIVASLLPPGARRSLPAGPAGLYETCWRPAQEDDRLQVLSLSGRFHDCGTPARYLAANLDWSGGESVVAADTEISGQVVRSVVWPGAVVSAGEVLVDAIRTGSGRTVLVR